ncbi:MAG: hypothetical protein R3285_02095 [Kiloniellales bacterium]|nr:hypothetical protein [Kiloniellales bacterium]
MFGSKKKDEAKPTARRGIKALVLVATLGWVLASLMVADKLHAQNMNGSLHSALVRSQTARQLLSSELKQKSLEIEALEKKLSRYQRRESQAAANP